MRSRHISGDARTLSELRSAVASQATRRVEAAASARRCRFHLLVIGLGLALLLSGCADSPSTLNPRGPGAAQIAFLAWVLFVIAGIVFVIVMGLLIYALFRRRRGLPGSEPPPGGSRTFVALGGAIIPALILVGVFVLTLGTMRALAMGREQPLTIRVTGYQWWWEVAYPDHDVVTANEIHIPVGQPVRLELVSGDVIHSFWVPELHGKMDLIPGQTNRFDIEASEAGMFWGQCAEFCGTQHARMAFVVIAQPVDEFAAWIAHQQQPAVVPADGLTRQGQQVFLGSACVYCHAIKGTNASSRFGPDLTHLASRQRIGAGILENNRGNLAGWILNPQTLKPGNKMPPSALTSAELLALLAYLESLE